MLAIRARQIGSNGLLLELELPDATPVRWDLLDVAGRVIRSEWLTPGEPGRRSVDLPRLADLSSGIYFLRVQQGAAEACSRAVVVR